MSKKKIVLTFYERCDDEIVLEGNVLLNDALNTFYLRLCGVSEIVLVGYKKI